jgi:hypothetical protein
MSFGGGHLRFPPDKEKKIKNNNVIHRSLLTSLLSKDFS